MEIKSKKTFYQIFFYVGTFDSLYKRKPDKPLLLINTNPKIKDKSEKSNNLKNQKSKKKIDIIIKLKVKNITTKQP